MVCEYGYENIDGECVLIPVECEDGYEFTEDGCVLIEVPEEEGLSTPAIVAIAVSSSLAGIGVIALIIKKIVLRV